MLVGMEKLGSREESNASTSIHHLKQSLIALALNIRVGPTRIHSLVRLVLAGAVRILRKRSLWEARSVVEATVALLHFVMAMALQLPLVVSALVHVVQVFRGISATRAQIVTKATLTVDYHVLAKRIAMGMAKQVESSGRTNLEHGSIVVLVIATLVGQVWSVRPVLGQLLLLGQLPV
jgi:hypothetical protein